MPLIEDLVGEVLHSELGEERGWDRSGHLTWSTPWRIGLPELVAHVRVDVTDLGRRGWMRARYSLDVDCSAIAESMPVALRRRMLVARGADTTRRWAPLWESTPFDCTDTEPTTAGVSDPEETESITLRHVVIPARPGLTPPDDLSTTSGLATSALTPADGYRLSMTRWRTAALLLTCAGRRDTAEALIREVMRGPRSGPDTDTAVAAFKAWLGDFGVPEHMTWQISDVGAPEPAAPPESGTVVPARELWRRPGHRRPETEPVTEYPLEAPLGMTDLDTWLEGMSILDLEFDTVDVRGTYGEITEAANQPIVERHLLDTFPTWPHATDPDNRDLLDRFQRHIGRLVELATPGTRWIAHHTPDDVFCPVVSTPDGRIIDPTETIRTALTDRTGHVITDLLADLRP